MQACLKEYHDELVRVRPEVAETYPFDTLYRDVAVGFNLLMIIVIPIFAAVPQADLPEDKAEFTFKS